MAIFLPCRRTRQLCWMVLFCTGIALGSDADQPAITYRAETTEVRLSFSATDQNDRSVAGLEAGDFVVVDKDIIVRDFKGFARSNSKNLEVAILIDTSESLTPNFRKEIGDVVEFISASAGVPENNISIFDFQGSQPALLCARQCRSSHAVDSLQAVRALGLTPLMDTAVYASEFLVGQGDNRSQRVLLIFSDGEDTVSRNSPREAVDAALNRGIAIYAIDFGNSVYSHGAQALYDMASATGGRCFRAQSGVSHALDLLLNDFRSTYTVSYRLPSHAAGFHETRVLPTHNLNLQFRSRSGYYYPNHAR